MLTGLLLKAKALAKELMGVSIRYSGILFIILNLYARHKVTLIVYHNPKPEILDEHLRYLSKRYRYITLDKLVDAIYSRQWNNIPPKSMVVTLDDGHRDNYKLLEVFRKHKVTPTVYLSSRLMDTKRHFWFMEKEIDPRKYKRLVNSERLQLLNNEIGYSPTMEFPDHERQALNKDEMMSMKNFVSFQSHSASHPILTTCTYDECKEEIFQSKIDVETMIGKECKHFAYPNGDYSEREIELLKEAGYRSGRTVDLGWNDLDTDPFMLKTSGISDNASINWVAAQLSGVPIYIQYLFKGSLNGRYPSIKLDEDSSGGQAADEPRDACHERHCLSYPDDLAPGSGAKATYEAP